MSQTESAMPEMVELDLKDGLVIHLAGVPLRLVGDAVATTHKGNVNMIRAAIPQAFIHPARRREPQSNEGGSK